MNGGSGSGALFLANSDLSDEHRELIRASAISEEVALARGYRTVTRKGKLTALGFSERQARVPALLIPIRSVHGEIVNYQARPELPRVVQGKPLKYETPKGSRMCLDVPLGVLEHLADPSVPLLITEGSRKADAGVSAGLCTIALLGVWGWRGTNGHGGKVALADWDAVALNGREVYLAFDSDVVLKPAVHAALARLAEFLKSRGAKVGIVYLPPSEGGGKVGLDDFLATGRTVQDLLVLVEMELRPPPAGEGGNPRNTLYFEQGGATFWAKPLADGTVAVQLANFTARIVAEVELDDGVEVRREYEIRAQVEGHAASCSVPARSFAGMNWVNEFLGVRAIVSPGFGQKDHLRAAIQSLSRDAGRRTVFTHTGWREIDDIGLVYLHAGGAIGPNGSTPGIEVRLPQALRAMVLPDPPQGEELAADVQGALALIDLGPGRLTWPLFSAVFRAAMGDTDFSLFVYGVTDSFKTETATIVQSFYGTDFHSRNLPGSWLSTGNALEALAFAVKDGVITVDDFVPTGSRQDMQRQHREAERLLRAQGNRAGRGRLGADTSLREGRPPRGMIVSTGEELPVRHSALARVFILEVERGDIDMARLTECQKRVAAGAHARVMSAFLAFIAPRYREKKESLLRRASSLRGVAQKYDRHRRTASIIGDLQAGCELFLYFATECARFEKEKAEDLRRRCWEALLESAEAQGRHQVAAEPASLFIRLLRSAVASGAAHIAGLDGGRPVGCGALGWRLKPGESGDTEVSWQSQGARVGWADEEHLYVDPDAALKAAQTMASDTERIPVTTTTLGKRLDERGYLASTERARGHVTVRRTLGGARRTVLHLPVGILTGAAQSAQSAHEPDAEATNGADGPKAWAETDGRPVETSPRNRPTDAPDDPGTPCQGPIGPIGPLGAPPPASCYACGGAAWWRLKADGADWVCTRCQPPHRSRAEIETRSGEEVSDA